MVRKRKLFLLDELQQYIVMQSIDTVDRKKYNNSILWQYIDDGYTIWKR